MLAASNDSLDISDNVVAVSPATSGRHDDHVNLSGAVGNALLGPATLAAVGGAQRETDAGSNAT